MISRTKQRTIETETLAGKLLDELEVVRNWLNDAIFTDAERKVGRPVPTHQIDKAIRIVWDLHGKPKG